MSLLLGRWAKLYSHQTECEKLMEPVIAAVGKPYRCQHPYWRVGCIMDFAWLEEKVCIEIDDPGHQRRAAQLKDAERTKKLEKDGWVVVRVTNEEVRASPAAALQSIFDQLAVIRKKQKEENDGNCTNCIGGSACGRCSGAQGLRTEDEEHGGRPSTGKAGATGGTGKGPAPKRRKVSL